MAKTAFGGARRGTGLVKVGRGRKVRSFNAGLPGGGGTTNSGRVTFTTSARSHGKYGFGAVTGGTNKNTPGRHPTPGHGGMGV
jgi:hypothetical protein